MNSRERFLTAMRGGVPDMVPATPDISNYIPCESTGLPYWEIYFEEALPLWRAYLKASDRYGIDAWIGSCAGIPFLREASKLERTSRLRMDGERDAMIRETRLSCAEGELTMEDLCFRRDPPTPRVKPIKDLERDWPIYKRGLTLPVAIDRGAIAPIRAECERRGQAFGLCIGYPGFQSWMGVVEGGIEPLAWALMDCPAILDEWAEIELAIGTKEVELFLAEKPDYLVLGGSGTITLASPDLARRFALPALARWSRMAREAGVATVLHSCGKSRILVDMLAEETEVDCVNPLEIAPMGDVELAEVKRSRGSRIALMGNLHTTDVMLRGTPEEVYAAALRAMRDAGQGGGFILSTGDQCPRDTPPENLHAFVAASRERGRYDAAGRLPGLEG
jgi:uroporphyrinogen decarboxylase